MGKKQHQKDKLLVDTSNIIPLNVNLLSRYLTANEWSSFYGGKKAGKCYCIS